MLMYLFQKNRTSRSLFYWKIVPEETENIDDYVPEENFSEETENVDAWINTDTFNVEEISIHFPDSDYISNGESIFYT